MKRIGSVVLKSLAFLVMASFICGNAYAQNASQPGADVGGIKNGSTRNQPQAFVVCTGWHALCTASPDCKMNGDKAYCDCMKVNEPHIVETSNIQDAAVKQLTLAQCTTRHRCDTDEAPVCKAIRDGQYEVDNVRYDWVSTFSYRGWCDI